MQNYFKNLAKRHDNFSFYAFHFALDGGYAALTTMILILTISITIIAAFSSFTLHEVNTNRTFTKSVDSHFISESGIEEGIYRILSGKLIPSNELLGVGNGTTTIQVTTVGSDRIVRSEGLHDNIQQNLETKVDVTTTGVNFHYGVQVGYLGLELENTAQVIGSIYSNGSIIASQNSRITGDAWVAGGTASTPNQSQQLFPQELPIKDTLNHRDAAQSFVPSITAVVRQLRLYIRKVNNPPSDATIRIRADNGGIPAKNGTSYGQATLNSGSIGASSTWVTVAINANDPLIAGQTYWIVIDYGGTDYTKYFMIGASDNTSYPAGTLMYSDSWDAGTPVWTPTNHDVAFQIFLGDVVTKIYGATVGQGGIGDAHANTIEDSTIAGKAYCQTISGSVSADGANICNPGSDPSPKDLPISEAQIAAFQAEGDAGGVCTPSVNPYCQADGDFELDHQATTTLDAVEITGNMRLENTASLIMRGTIHVRGDFIINNTCKIQLDPATYGSNSGVIVIDGKADISNRCQLLGSGVASSSYMMILTTSPYIAAPPSIKLSNTSSGAIFYAAHGTLELENKTDVKEAVGQKLKVSNTGTVTYETGLADIQFSSGPGGGYNVTNWQQAE